MYVSVAQGTEHRSPKAGVGGSNPLRDTTSDLFELLLLSRQIRCESTVEPGNVKTAEAVFFLWSKRRGIICIYANYGYPKNLKDRESCGQICRNGVLVN